MSRAPITVIVAATRSNGIGKDGILPWRLAKEMSYFSQVTTRAPNGTINALIMGRKTWESIPTKFRPLKERLNIVITRNPHYNLGKSDKAPARQGSSVSDALETLEKDAATSIYRIFLIGGAQLYNECLALPTTNAAYVNRVLLTRVHEPSFEECDTFLTDISSSSDWSRATHKELEAWVGMDVPSGIQQENEVRYEFQMWTRT